MLAATLQAIEENAADFVFLDGVVDLCQAFNDEEKSRATILELDKLATERNAAILGLIHTNAKDEKARGHLGSILQQKSAEIYQVDKQEGSNVAKWKQPRSRFAPVPEITFSFADDFELQPAGEALEKMRAETRSQFSALFADKKRLTSGELAAAYAAAHGCSKRKAEGQISAATKSGILYKAKEGNKVFYSYLFPAEIDTQDDDII